MEWAIAAAGWVMAPLIASIGQDIQDYFKAKRMRKALQRAIQGAFKAFARENPAWANEQYFDKIFLESRAAPLLAGFLNRGQLPEPGQLVTAWHEYGLRVDNAEAERVATNFLGLFEDYTRAQEPLQVLVERQVSDRTMEAGEQSAELLEQIVRATEAMLAAIRQRDIDDGLAILSEAAFEYTEAARDYQPGADAGEATYKARLLAKQAGRKLRGALYESASQTLAAFDRLIVERFEDVVQARDGGLDGRAELVALRDGARDFEDGLSG